MTTEISAVNQTAYIKGVTQKLQSKGFFLRGTSREPDRIEGKTCQWRVGSRGDATPLSTTIERAKPMNLEVTPVEATLTDWQAADWVKFEDINRLNFKEQDQIQKSAAYALGRRFDIMHMEALEGASLHASHVIGDGSTAITLVDVMDAGDVIKGEGILDSMDIFCPLPGRLFSKLKLYKEFSNAEWAGGDLPLARGADKVTWNGVHYFAAPNEMFLYDTGRSKDAWKTAAWVQTQMYLKPALGFATSYTMQSKITWENLYTSYFCNNWMDGVAKVILAEGVSRLKFTFTKPVHPS